MAGTLKSRRSNDNERIGIAAAKERAILADALGSFIGNEASSLARRLISHFGSLSALGAASEAEILKAIPGEHRAARLLTSSRFFTLFALEELAA
ncbi:hypothetical protein [Croceicoccus gelatinilyticus]|uniref:hypothetical protein n=1 Tax=Croceicoccus gelatinilyticus TaxID=2835536 RepID=UPI001BCA86B8|nr:hypothetical protein [Croceicoccus gelatinilyticus]MBS7671713.1 hypothetical protein [Croceicoccus gelatinilyticus]